jgi:UDPglucose--hexose-1-phosphate uridylyltransferase
MTDIRHDKLTGRWVIIEPERNKRPGAHPVTSENSVAPEDCPFCPGNERETPEEIVAVRAAALAANKPGWIIRVFPNKYPILSGPLTSAGNDAWRHEVIIETPAHVSSLTALSLQEVQAVFRMYIDRIRALRSAGTACVPVLFKNVGSLAGASQEHAHAQLLALPQIPPDLALELSALETWKQQEDCCYYCRLLEDERAAGSRMVIDTAGGCVLTPNASRFPYEMLLLPARHRADFDELSDAEADQAATLLHRGLIALEQIAPGCHYNFTLQTAPMMDGRYAEYHWHLRITPRLAGIAGCELGAGLYVNPVPPEVAAAQLRTVLS